MHGHCYCVPSVRTQKRLCPPHTKESWHFTMKVNYSEKCTRSFYFRRPHHFFLFLLLLCSLFGTRISDQVFVSLWSKCNSLFVKRDKKCHVFSNIHSQNAGTSIKVYTESTKKKYLYSEYSKDPERSSARVYLLIPVLSTKTFSLWLRPFSVRALHKCTQRWYFSPIMREIPLGSRGRKKKFGASIVDLRKLL